MKHFQKLLRMAVPVGIAAAGLLLFCSSPAVAEAMTVTPEAQVSIHTVSVATGTTTATNTTEVPIATDTMEVPTATDTTQTPTATDVTVLSGTWTSTDAGRMYCYADGSYATGMQFIEGIVYLFDENGIQQTDWQTVRGLRYYYDSETGTAAVGKVEIDGIIYLFNYNGAQQTGWRTVNGARYFYDPQTGELLTGWITYNGNRYYCDASGKQCGEVTIDGVRYALHATYGYQMLGFCTFSDGVISYYQEDGSPCSGWFQVDGKTYYASSTYQVATGWQTISGSQYYFDASGMMQMGLVTISGNQYYFNASGVMQTGWQTISGSKYYFNASGVMQTSWQTISGNQYYFNASGVMQTGWVTISGSKYYFDASGVMQTGLQKINNSYYIFSTDGTLLVSSSTNKFSGIDVSKWQGTIDWDKVKASGKVQFAMIRAGYGSSTVDPQFERNYSECNRVGIATGVYWYCYATTVEEAKKEAYACLAALDGKSFELPIVYDIEESSSMANASAIADAFCSILQDAGYSVGIYSYKSALENYFSSSVLSKYNVWVAHVNVSQTTYSGTYMMWQYSWKGSISGISGDVDLDYLYYV